ncbi:FAD-binding oxidoreductase [Clostridium sediminicola]|uniref:FAD-binding oxidoreductase n=1 Tax=Clostridium sediminicola TaxID=3114879 RepID=UPI0031F1FA83
MTNELIKEFDVRYEEYLSDESKMKGQAQSISFPKSKEQVLEIVKELSVKSIPITVQGGKTGICGGAVPSKGHMMNLTNMNRIKDYKESDDKRYIIVEPGITLEELDKELYKRHLFWPPEPTETSATVGGVIATNAKGIGAFLYGDTNKYVEEILFVDYHGEIMTVKRGENIFKDNKCTFPNGKVIHIDIKVLGFEENCDLLDILIGSEGMYGVIVEATLLVISRPKEIWGIGFFFEEENELCGFAEKIKNISIEENTAFIAAVEYIDKKTFGYIEELKKVATKLKELPNIEEEMNGMVYIEIHGKEEEGIENIAEELMELAMEFGSDADKAWAVSGESEMDKVRAFRHAAPESINVVVDKTKRLDGRITKLGTDITIENKSFSEILQMYREDAKKEDLEIAVFGHVAGNHVHVNIIPQNYEQFKRGEKLIQNWALKAAEQNGKVISEHGVGKIKKDLFKLVAKEDFLKEFKSLKEQLDPNNFWNRGNSIF